MMTGILKPTDGQALVNGISAYENRIENARSMVAVFGQRTQLWWDLPVIENCGALEYGSLKVGQMAETDALLGRETVAR
jgi:ABC-2 type transport system ATP-binding protein